MRTAKNILFVVFLTLLFGWVVFLMFSCTSLKPNGITVIPETANVEPAIYFLEHDRLIP